MKLTSNKPVKEMGNYELAHNCCYSKEGVAWYRDYENDMNAKDFTRKLMKKYTEIELSEDNDVFLDEMYDMLCNDPFKSIEGLIALFYRNLWAMADLRETLKEYEENNSIFYPREAILQHLNPDKKEKIEKIEEALGFKLTSQQLSYIECGHMRKTGKTTAHIISLLINPEIPMIDLSIENIGKFIEKEPTTAPIAQRHIFKEEFKKIKEKLDKAGIETTRVKY